jgi:predicted DNA-binding transcriptional regulator YafY
MPVNLYENVIIDYTNWRGERAMRHIRPLTIRFESSEWHPDEQWLLRAVDLEKGATRDFAMKDIRSWRPLLPSPQDTKEADHG